MTCCRYSPTEPTAGRFSNVRFHGPLPKRVNRSVSVALLFGLGLSAGSIGVAPSTNAVGIRGVVVASAPIPTQTDTTPTTVAVTTPLSYVNEALDFIEQMSFRKSTLDWKSIRANAEAKARSATSIDAAHDIIADAIKTMDDKHSSFTRPPQAQLQATGNYSGFGFVAVWPSRTVVTVAQGSPAFKAGLRLGDRITKIDGRAPAHTDSVITVPRNKRGDFPAKIIVTVTRKGVRLPKNLTMALGTVTLVSVPTAAVVPPKVGGGVGPIGYLDVPGLIGDATVQKSYAQELQDAIRTTDAQPRCGWVVDLRRNRGGYIYAMLAGLGPLLGTGDVGGQLNAAGTRTMWSYTDGTLFAGESAVIAVDRPYRLADAAIPVAVLTSGLTASAGEATTIAFRHRPNSRSFGEKTVGLTTFNVRKRMPDGAFLDILNAVDVDRAGTVYDGPIPPEQPTTIDWNNIGNASDPVLTTAINWLNQQPSCAAR